jgi:hypothetical protein
MPSMVRYLRQGLHESESLEQSSALLAATVSGGAG